MQGGQSECRRVCGVERAEPCREGGGGPGAEGTMKASAARGGRGPVCAAAHARHASTQRPQASPRRQHAPPGTLRRGLLAAVAEGRVLRGARRPPPRGRRELTGAPARRHGDGTHAPRRPALSGAARYRVQVLPPGAQGRAAAGCTGVGAALASGGRCVLPPASAAEHRNDPTAPSWAVAPACATWHGAGCWQQRQGAALLRGASGSPPRRRVGAPECAPEGTLGGPPASAESSPGADPAPSGVARYRLQVPLPGAQGRSSAGQGRRAQRRRAGGVLCSCAPAQTTLMSLTQGPPARCATAACCRSDCGLQAPVHNAWGAMHGLLQGAQVRAAAGSMRASAAPAGGGPFVWSPR